MPEVKIEAAEIKERKADSKGRVALGPEHSNEILRVAVIETVGEQSSN